MVFAAENKAITQEKQNRDWAGPVTKKANFEFCVFPEILIMAVSQQNPLPKGNDSLEESRSRKKDFFFFFACTKIFALGEGGFPHKGGHLHGGKTKNSKSKIEKAASRKVFSFFL